MKITLAKHAGFCPGVKKAIDTALGSKDKPLYALGDIIHNSYVLSKLKNSGIITVQDVSELPNDSVVLIRAHGVSKDIIDKLNEKNIKIIDSTCIFVSKIQKMVEKYQKDNYRIIIIGKPEHPEIIGINGWCDNSSIIISNMDDVKKIQEDNTNRYAVFAQTTFDSTLYNKIINYLEKKLTFVEFFNTICYTTKERQIEANELSKQNDIMLVIGDKKSSNTQKLFEISLNNCPNTYLISNLIDLESIKLNKKHSRLGILAGASTPKELIEEVTNRMSEVSQNVGSEEIVEETIVNEESNVIENAPNEKEDWFDPKYSPKNYKLGQVFRNAKVITADESGITVQLSTGIARDAFVSPEEAEVDGVVYDPENYKEGSVIAVQIISTPKGEIIASKKVLDQRIAHEEELKEIIENGKEFEVTIQKKTKGGLIGYLFDAKEELFRIDVFIPASHIKFGYVGEEGLEKYVGKKMKLVYLENKTEKPKKEKTDDVVEGQEETVSVDVQPEEEAIEKTEDTAKKKPINYKKIRNIKASHRILIEKDRKEKDEIFWQNVKPGEIVEGKVKKFTDFGAFVNVFGFDCVVHISNIAWYKIENSSDILKAGQVYDFLVLDTNEEEVKENPRNKKRVSLGYKQLQKPPYEVAREKYHVGEDYMGVVARVEPFGAFVDFYQTDENGDYVKDESGAYVKEKGIDGMIPVAEIAHSWVENATKVLNPGDEVTFKIIKFNDFDNKITLSIKATLEKPEDIDDADLSDDAAAQDKGSKRKRDLSKFNYDKDANSQQPARKQRKKSADKSDKDEVKHWVDDDQVSTKLGDLFKDLKFDDFE